MEQIAVAALLSNSAERDLTKVRDSSPKPFRSGSRTEGDVLESISFQSEVKRRFEMLRWPEEGCVQKCVSAVLYALVLHYIRLR